MKSFKNYIVESEVALRFKDLLPKKWKHAYNRLIHKDKYKQAIKAIHKMKKQYPDYSDSKILDIISGMSNLKKKELKAVLNRKTRYESDELMEEITKANLNDVEKFADKIFAKVGIDIEFTKHFLDRVNDKRNGKDITVAELTRLFKQTYKKHGKKIPKMGDDAEAVLNDLQTDINLPFVLQWDGKEFDLIAKTVMRKKDFKTNNIKLRV